MQIRLTPENASKVRKLAASHRRIFRRRLPFAVVVNDALRDLLAKSAAKFKSPDPK